jgi:hypothetical protein
MQEKIMSFIFRKKYILCKTSQLRSGFPSHGKLASSSESLHRPVLNNIEMTRSSRYIHKLGQVVQLIFFANELS